MARPAYVAAGLLGAGLAVLLLRARRRPAATSPGTAAARRFHERAARADDELAEAFAEYLGERLGVAAPAVIAPDLAQRLTDAGVESELATRAAAQLDALVAARYGGAPPPDSADATRALVDELERS